MSGTIQDFGVADIFQLISQQAKTGRLSLSNGVETVLVMFKDGRVVHAETASTPPERLFGSLLVRAEIIDAKQLERALEVQRRTLERIGAVLVSEGFVDEATVTEMARLQVTETLYGLFEWSRGTYEFETSNVDMYLGVASPIRAEHLVMNGIRMTDEWPGIRARIPSYDRLVERVRPLPPAPAPSEPADPFGLTVPPEDPIGPPERAVYALVRPGRTVQKLVDVSRLGEFETCRALSELMGQGYVRVVEPVAQHGERLSWRERTIEILGELGRVTVSATLVVAAGAVFARGLAMRQAPRELRLENRAVHRRVEVVQRRVIERALELHRLDRGRYPERLAELVEADLLPERALDHPLGDRYHYQRVGDAFVILPPIR